jgi:2-methylcitrate dehydratase PrpD
MLDLSSNATTQMKTIVDFICDTKYEDVPAKAIENAKGRILDGIGVTINGTTDTVGEIIKSFISDFHGEPHATVICTGLKADCLYAAFANGTMMHATDFDDIYMLSHSTTCVLPAVIAVSELMNATGKEMLMGYLIGNELYTKIQQCTSTEPWYRGFHGTSIWGSVAAAGAAARMLKLDKEKTCMAIGMSCSMFGGIKRNQGTMTKPLHAGYSAENGVKAALMAKYGLRSHPEAFEGKFSFTKIFSSNPQYEYIQELGKTWDMITMPPWIKPHPNCGSTHAAMGGMLELIEKYDIKEDQVEKVEVGMTQAGIDALFYDEPKDAYQAKFSMQFAIALLLHTRKWGLAMHTEEIVQDPAIRKLFKKIKFYHNTTLQKELPPDKGQFEAQLDVTMKDGTKYSARPGLPDLNYEQIQQKFHECANGILSEIETENVCNLVSNLENVPSVHDLMINLA